MPDRLVAARSLARTLVGNERGLRMRMLSVGLRSAPSFLIIGAQKGGTTSLYSYLCRHPEVRAAARIEIHYFDLAYEKGWWWYKSHFPMRVGRSTVVTGESSPYYLFHPLAPRRVRRDLPDVRLIALLRNPVDRAFSHYQHVRRNGREELSFEQAVASECERTRGEAERLRDDPGAQSVAHRRYSYLGRGRYADQLTEWLEHFELEQLLVLRSEDMFSDPASVCARVWAFLELPAFELDRYPIRNEGGYGSAMPAHVRRRLIEYFDVHNRRLEAMLGWERGWEG